MKRPLPAPENVLPIKRKLWNTSKFAFSEPEPSVMEFVSEGVSMLLNTLKLLISPAASKWRARSPSFQSNALFTIMSGCKLGMAVLDAAAVPLEAPLPLSNCPEKNELGKTTEVGAYCCGFSRAAPMDHQLVG